METIESMENTVEVDYVIMDKADKTLFGGYCDTKEAHEKNCGKDSVWSDEMEEAKTHEPNDNKIYGDECVTFESEEEARKNIEKIQDIWSKMTKLPPLNLVIIKITHSSTYEEV
jgi:hypothetical protein